MNEHEYVDRVLDNLPRTTPRRDQIAMELRGHIAERVSHGQPLADVLGRLGDPARLAESYRSAVPLDPAPYSNRIRAKVIDVLAAAGIAAVPAAATLLLVPADAFPLVFAGGMVCALVGFVIYTIVAEHRAGQTIGKRLSGLQVVTESGAPISLGQSTVRQLPFALSIVWIDALFAFFTERRQRAFELLSKTRVVRASSGN
jgi:uncharacterized RDD family membrane protein YckC